MPRSLGVGSGLHSPGLLARDRNQQGNNLFSPQVSAGTPPRCTPGLTRTIPGLPELLVYELHLLQAALELLDAVKQGQGRRHEATGGRLGDGVPAPATQLGPEIKPKPAKPSRGFW